MTRYKKGSKVEVLRKQAVPGGSWRCAEIVYGNGHNYTVRYDMAALGEPALERVSRKLIRPCPPPEQTFENWIPGDVVEVLCDYSWKMATVSKVLRGNQFMVRLVGSSNEFKVSKIDIRLRQSWTNGKWIIIGQGSGNCEDLKYNGRSSIVYHQTSCSQVQERKTYFDSHEEKNNFSNQNNGAFQESCILRTRTLKRSPPYCYSQDRAHEVLTKFRAIEKDGRCQRVTTVDLSLVPEKVDSYVYARKSPKQKEICSLLDKGVTNLSKMNNERTKIYGAVKNSQLRTLECDDSVTSSVGSCSMGSNPLEWPSRILACHKEGAEDHSSDAESTCQMPNEEVNCLVSIEEELAREIHRAHLEACISCFQKLKVMLGLPPFFWSR